MNDLVIYGCGSVGRMVEQIVFDINATQRDWNIIGFIDDDTDTHGTTVAGLPVLGGVAGLKQFPKAQVALGFSNPRHKWSAVAKLKDAGVVQLATLIHPTAWISRRVAFGNGTIIYPGVHIDVDVKIGHYVLLNKLCTIGHDTQVGDYVTAAPAVNIGGNCHIGEGFEFGINSSTIQGLSLGAWSVLGAGGVAVKSLDTLSVYAGVPAKVIRAIQAPIAL